MSIRALGRSLALRVVRARLGSAIPLLSLLVAPVAALAELPITLERMTLVSTHGRVTDMLVEAERAEFDERSEVAQLTAVRARLRREDGSLSLELTCDEGEFRLDSNDFVATGNVNGLLGDGRRFTGPWLRYDDAKGVAYTEAPVQIMEGNRTLTGGGFRYYVQEGRLRLLGGASVLEGR